MDAYPFLLHIRRMFLALPLACCSDEVPDVSPCALGSLEPVPIWCAAESASLSVFVWFNVIIPAGVITQI